MIAQNGFITRIKIIYAKIGDAIIYREETDYSFRKRIRENTKIIELGALKYDIKGITQELSEYLFEKLCKETPNQIEFYNGIDYSQIIGHINCRLLQANLT